VIMVQIAGVATGIFLIAVVWAVYYLRRTETDPRLHGGRAFAVCLAVSSVAIALLGVYSFLDVLGVI
jgi:cytochrome bd-type quinol oxidase subunit 1